MGMGAGAYNCVPPCNSWDSPRNSPELGRQSPGMLGYLWSNLLVPLVVWCQEQCGLFCDIADPWNVHVGISSIKTTLPIPLESSGDLKEYQFLITWGFHLASEANNSAWKNNVMSQAPLTRICLRFLCSTEISSPTMTTKRRGFWCMSFIKNMMAGWLASWMGGKREKEWVSLFQSCRASAPENRRWFILFTENSRRETLSEYSHVIWIGCSAPKIPSYSKMYYLIILWIESFLLLGKVWFFFYFWIISPETLEFHKMYSPRFIDYKPRWKVYVKIFQENPNIY